MPAFSGSGLSKNFVFVQIPKFNRQPLDLAKLWNAVRRNGGSSKVSPDYLALVKICISPGLSNEELGTNWT